MEPLAEWAGDMPHQQGSYRVRTIPSVSPPVHCAAAELPGHVEALAEQLAAAGGGRIAVRLPDGTERTRAVPGGEQLATLPAGGPVVEAPAQGAALDAVSMAHALQSATAAQHRLAHEVATMARELREAMRAVSEAHREALRQLGESYQGQAQLARDLSAALVSAAEQGGEGFWSTAGGEALASQLAQLAPLLLAKAGG